MHWMSACANLHKKSAYFSQYLMKNIQDFRKFHLKSPLRYFTQKSSVYGDIFLKLTSGKKIPQKVWSAKWEIFCCPEHSFFSERVQVWSNCKKRWKNINIRVEEMPNKYFLSQLSYWLKRLKHSDGEMSTRIEIFGKIASVLTWLSQGLFQPAILPLSAGDRETDLQIKTGNM